MKKKRDTRFSLSDRKLLDEIARQLSEEWQVGGLWNDGFYGEFTLEILYRYEKAKRALATPLPHAEDKEVK